MDEIFCMIYGTARKVIFSFFRHPEKMVFQKKSRWNMIFVVLLWKIMFLFPENIILHPRRKMIFLVLSGKMVFFAENTIFFLWAGSQRWPFSRNTCKYDIFYVHVWVSQTWCHALLPKKKNQRSSYPARIHLKVIDVLDWYPRKSSSNSLYFHGDLYGRFYVLLSSEKTQET